MSSLSAIKRIRALHRKKERAASGLAIAQGEKLVSELLGSELIIRELHVRADMLELLQLIGARPYELAEQHELDKMTTMLHGCNAIAVFEQPHAQVFSPVQDAVYLACDGVSDPGNLGTIIRSADCFGIAGVICGAGTVDPFNPKTVQSAMGSLFRVALFSMNLQELPQCGVQIYTAQMVGESLFTLSFDRPAVVVLGNETHGIGTVIERAKPITIPNTGNADSLNVSMAAAVIAAEVFRKQIA